MNAKKRELFGRSLPRGCHFQMTKVVSFRGQAEGANTENLGNQRNREHRANEREET